MKIIKPLTASLLTRPYRWRGANRLAVGIYILLSQDESGQLLEPDQKLWAEMLPQLDSGGLLDQIMPKSRAEYLISGSAYTAHQSDKTRCMVRAQVADLEKTLLVHGDRYWNAGRASAAQAFEKMPVDWSHAFGGPDHPENPQGKGLYSVEQKGEGTYLRSTPLPNIEDPLKPVEKASDRPMPAGFGPIGPTHPRQMEKMGTYSEDWEKYDFPGFLPDMDPSIFNMASDDQQWASQNGLPLGKPYRIWNMHPKQPCWEGVIPMLKARCFLQRRDIDKRCKFEEVGNMQASTIWFLPDAQSMIMMFHGSVMVHDSEADDIEVAMAAVEDVNSSRSSDHYERIMQLRLDPETAALHHPQDTELMPQALLRASRAMDYRLPQGKTGDRVQAFVENQQNALQSWMKTRGMNYHDYVPELVGPPEQFDNSLQSQERSDQIFESMKAQVQEQLRASEEPLLAEYADSLDEDESDQATKITYVKQSGPPDLSVVDASYSQTAYAGESGDSSSLEKRARQTKSDLRKGYLYSVQYQEPAARLSPELNDPVRREVQRRYQENGDLTELDLTGADLSGLDLSGADFSRSFMESVKFAGARLHNVNFTETVLARAHFEDTHIEDCNFTRASLAEAIFSGCTVRKCEWTETQCDHLRIDNSTLKECRLIRLMCDGWLVQDSVLDDCLLEACMLSESQFKSVRFTKGNWMKVAFTDCTWKDCHTINANWDSASFMTCRIEGCEWVSSKLVNMLFEDDLILADCQWRDCSLLECTFLAVQAERLAFTGSDLSESDFTKAKLRNCSFDSVLARDAIFHKADLQGATFRNADLIQASLEQSRLESCNFEGATLFRTNVSKVSVNARTRLRNAYRDQLEIYPIYRDREQQIANLMKDE